MRATVRVGWLARMRPTPAPSFSVAIGACLLITAWLGAPVATSGGGKEAPTAQSLIDKAIIFHGGLKALDRDVAILRIEESEMLLEGEKIPVKAEWQHQPPDKRAFQASVKIGSLQLRVTGGLIGLKGWMKVGPSPAADLSPKQAAGQFFEQINHVKNVQLQVRAAQNYDFGSVKAARFVDRDAWQLHVVSKKSKHGLTVFFDQRTGQVLGDESERVLLTPPRRFAVYLGIADQPCPALG
jgi:hypothetical protein